MSDSGYPLVRKNHGDLKSIGFWKMGRTIGTGSSGRVRIARHSRTGQHAAVKIVSKTMLASRVSLNHLAEQADHNRLSLEREIVVMKLLDHPNVMRLYDVWETSSELFLILEYVQGGELFDYLCQKGKLPLPEALHYFQQIIGALDYCHRINIAHRDLKPENILLDEDFNIKIADFGMAVWHIHGAGHMLVTSCGSPHYACPEIVKGEPYTGSAADIWSCGVILFALLSGKLPFDHEDGNLLLGLVREGKYEIPGDLNPLAQDLIRQMLTIDPKNRITMPQIVKHSFFNLHKPKLDSKFLPSLIDIAHPIKDASLIDPYIFANLKALWYGTPDDNLVASLLDNEPTWQKAVYHLLMEYRIKNVNAYQEEEDIITQKRLERRRTRKVNEGAVVERYSANARIEPSASSFPTRNDPPTPRRAARRLGLAMSVSDESISRVFEVSSALPSFCPVSTGINISQPLDVLESLDNQPGTISTVHVEDCLESFIILTPTDSCPQAPVSPDLLSTIPANVFSSSPIDTSTHKTAARSSLSHVLSKSRGTRPLTIKRKSRLPRKTVNSSDKENNRPDELRLTRASDQTSRQQSREIGSGGKRIQLVEPTEQKVSEFLARPKKANRTLSTAGPASLTRRPTFTLPSFSSSSPKRTWLNMFKLRPATHSLISSRDIHTTRSECRRLLTEMNIQVIAKNIDDLGPFRCRLDEVKEASGVMNLLKAIEFRVVFQRPQVYGEELQVMSLTLIHERGSLETFREICTRLEELWGFEA